MRRFLLPVLLLSLLIPPLPAHASAALTISEIAWVGSVDSASDEWIELHNAGSTPVDLTGFRILDDGATSYALSGVVPAHGYFVLERREEAISTPAGLVIAGISLGNDGDRLQLQDAAGMTLDDVNPSGGAWPAGSATTKGTMARQPDDSWATTTTPSAVTASLGSTVLGTPGASNDGVVTSASLALTTTPSAAPGATVTVNLEATALDALASYGATITYDPTVLEFLEAASAGLIGTVASSFQAGLQNDEEGVLVLAESQTATTLPGVDAAGTLATITFRVLPDASAGATAIALLPASFAATANADIAIVRTDASLTILPAVGTVTILTVTPGTDRYALALAWAAPAGGADSYRVYRRTPTGAMTELGTTTTLAFTDSLNLIPTRAYGYEVRAVRGTSTGEPVSASGADPRGILGDGTRDDATDGRDLASLARSWARETGDAGFAVLSDTTVDGAVDGADLVDLALNWARTYP